MTIILLTIGLLSVVASLDSRKWRNSFPRIEKKGGDFRVSLTSLISNVVSTTCAKCVLQLYSKGSHFLGLAYDLE